MIGQETPPKPREALPGTDTPTEPSFLPERTAHEADAAERRGEVGDPARIEVEQPAAPRRRSERVIGEAASFVPPFMAQRGEVVDGID